MSCFMNKCKCDQEWQPVSFPLALYRPAGDFCWILSLVSFCFVLSRSILLRSVSFLFSILCELLCREMWRCFRSVIELTRALSHSDWRGIGCPASRCSSLSWSCSVLCRPVFPSCWSKREPSNNSYGVVGAQRGFFFPLLAEDEIVCVWVRVCG